MDEIVADYYEIWSSDDHSLAVCVDALERLCEAVELTIPACGCEFAAEYQAYWESLDSDEQDREYAAIMSPVTTGPYRGDPLDQEAARVASRLLSGNVSYLENRLSHPLTAATLEPLRRDRASTYSRPPHIPYLPGIVEDLQLMVARESELNKRVGGKVRQLLNRLLAGRVEVCECFFRNATRREVEAWAHAKARRFCMAHAHDAVARALEHARSLGYPEDEQDVIDIFLEHPYDASFAAHIAAAPDSADEKHLRTRAILERWRSLTADDLAQPPAVLYKQLIELIDSLDDPMGYKRRRQSPRPEV